jgi:hypothetical protein
MALFFCPKNATFAQNQDFMNKFLWSIPLILVLFGCGNPVDKIDAKELKTACDCAQAAEILITERLDIQESAIEEEKKDFDTTGIMARWTKMSKKQDEVLKVCKDKLEVKKCPEWATISKKLAARGDALNKRVEANAIKKKAN